jgi:sugar/nucleoside kinase (ribokinase family)
MEKLIMDPSCVIAGRLRRDYLLLPVGRPLIDVPGGDLLYTAAGLGVWNGRVGLLARAGEDYPHDWLRSFEKRGWDTRGIRLLADVLDLRYFQAMLPDQTIQRSNPVPHFARLGLPFPKSLLGYQPPVNRDNDRKAAHPASPRPTDIPPDYLYARAVHLCPLDYLTVNRLTSAFREASVGTLTLDPSSAYMNIATFDDMRVLLHGMTAFLPSEEEMRALFWGRSDDLWQMAEALGECGCEFIVVKRGARGQMLYDSISKKRWEIPAYPARLADLTGAGNSFCGGFLAGYQQTYDPLRGVLHGSVSASLTIEGSGAFHALEAMPGLAQRRLDSLAGIARQV